MSTITYTPNPCRKEDASIKGEVVLKLPCYEDRLEILSQNPELLKEAMKELDDSKKKGKHQEEQVTPEKIKTFISLLKWSYRYYVKVDLTRVKDKKKISSLEDLKESPDPACADILRDIATSLSNGIDLGNS